jgi:2-polyprenyl-6-hydroxyphenyl methylase/3-demethylubiquinone-9 3-methyltransferase
VETTADKKEIENFAAMSAKWWDESGPMAPLHRFAPVRIDYILQSLRRRKRLGSADGALASLRVLDIGCGGGILAEPLARLGAEMTGIDATPQAIDAAKAHAKAMGLEINYMCCTAEALAETCAAEGQKFDLIYASEVIEHVADRRLFITAIASMLAENGTVVITTINRSLAAFALAKVALEYIVRMVPAGTHDPKKFVKPEELRAEFGAVGIDIDDVTGFVPRPDGSFRQSGTLAINYGASGGWAGQHHKI